MKYDAVVAVINYKGKILLGKKRKDSSKILSGKWHILGETKKFGESDEIALKRCAKEEANLEIKVGKYIGKHITPTNQRVARWYECFALTNKIKYGSDLDEIKWVPKNHVLRIFKFAINFWPKEIYYYFK